MFDLKQEAQGPGRAMVAIAPTKGDAFSGAPADNKTEAVLSGDIVVHF